MNMKRILALLLALCMALALCACGGNDDADTPVKETEPQTQDTPVVEDEPQQETEEETEAAAPSGISYQVTLVDEGGNPITGTMIQICQGELCMMPCATDANGVATFTVMEDGVYEAKLLSLPEGYEYISEETVFPFGNAYELTITLKAVA